MADLFLRTRLEILDIHIDHIKHAEEADETDFYRELFNRELLTKEQIIVAYTKPATAEGYPFFRDVFKWLSFEKEAKFSESDIQHLKEIRRSSQTESDVVERHYEMYCKLSEPQKRVYAKCYSENMLWVSFSEACRINNSRIKPNQIKEIDRMLLDLGGDFLNPNFAKLVLRECTRAVDPLLTHTQKEIFLDHFKCQLVSKAKTPRTPSHVSSMGIIAGHLEANPATPTKEESEESDEVATPIYKRVCPTGHRGLSRTPDLTGLNSPAPQSSPCLRDTFMQPLSLVGIGRAAK